MLGRILGTQVYILHYQNYLFVSISPDSDKSYQLVPRNQIRKLLKIAVRKPQISPYLGLYIYPSTQVNLVWTFSAPVGKHPLGIYAPSAEYTPMLLAIKVFKTLKHTTILLAVKVLKILKHTTMLFMETQ